MRNLVALSLAAALAVPSVASAYLQITEVMPQTSSGTASTINGDWWELTNFGSSAVNLSGYKWADTEDDVNGQTPQPNIFPSITINPGQSIIILEEPAANEAAWRANWGIPSSVVILGTDEMLPTPPATDTFSGLGASNDGLYFYDPSDNVLSSFLYTTITRGVSFEFGPGGTSLGLSVVGENFAVRGGNNDIGSPGSAVVPEPSALALIVPAAALISRRRRA